MTDDLRNGHGIPLLQVIAPSDQQPFETPSKRINDGDDLSFISFPRADSQPLASGLSLFCFALCCLMSFFPLSSLFEKRHTRGRTAFLDLHLQTSPTSTLAMCA